MAPICAPDTIRAARGGRPGRKRPNRCIPPAITSLTSAAGLSASPFFRAPWIFSVIAATSPGIVWLALGELREVVGACGEAGLVRPGLVSFDECVGESVLGAMQNEAAIAAAAT